MGWAIVAALVGIAGVQGFIHFAGDIDTPFLYFLAPAALLGMLLWMLAKGRATAVRAIKEGRGGIARLDSSRVVRQTGDPDDTLIDYHWTVSLDNGLFYRHTTRRSSELGQQDKFRLVVQPNSNSPRFLPQSGLGADGQRLRSREARLEGVTDIPEWPGTRVPRRVTDVDDPYRIDDAWQSSSGGAHGTGGAPGTGPQPGDIADWASSLGKQGMSLAKTLPLSAMFLVVGAAGSWWVAKADFAVAVDNVRAGASVPTVEPTPSDPTTEPTTGAAGAPGAMPPETEEPQQPEEPTTQAEPEPEETAEESPILEPLTAEGLSAVLAGFEKMAGTNETTEVNLYDEHASTKMPIEPGSDKFDSYDYHQLHGFRHEGPAPIQPRPDDDGRFTFDEIDPAVVERLVQSAPEVSGYTEEKVSHVIISRLNWAVAPGKVTIRVYIRDDYSSSLLWYDTNGKLLRHSR